MLAIPSIQINGVESLQNSLLICKVWAGLVYSWQFHWDFVKNSGGQEKMYLYGKQLVTLITLKLYFLSKYVLLSKQQIQAYSCQYWLNIWGNKPKFHIFSISRNCRKIYFLTRKNKKFPFKVKSEITSFLSKLYVVSKNQAWTKGKTRISCSVQFPASVYL